MKRLYRENSNGTKELTGYDYDGVIIELDYKDSRSFYNPYRRYGYLVPQLREILGYWWFETLREAKENIDKYLKGGK